jgi:hypothetical protein
MFQNKNHFSIFKQVLMKRHLSLNVHTIYVILTGLQLIFIPNMLLNMFGFDATSEIWIKVLGLVVMSLAFMYHAIGQLGNTEVVRATVWARWFVGAGFLLLVVFGQAKPNLILFAGIDLATATWTWFELRK